MHTNWLIGIFFLMIIASLISGIIEMQYLGGSADVVAVFEQIFNPGAVSSGTVLGINIGFISTSIAFITGYGEHSGLTMPFYRCLRNNQDILYGD